MMGARIGRRAEISTVSQMSPKLTRIGAQSFFADGSMIGGNRIHRGLLELRESRIGHRSFVGNGVYRQTWSFTPAADESEYEQRLEDALFAALSSDADLDQPARRLVLHLAKKTGHREIAAARRAMKRAGVSIPAAFLRLDDSTLFDLADGSQETLAPPKGLAVRLDEWRMLLQSNGLTALGPPDSPLLAELNEESDVGSEALDELVAQAFRLSHANWRGFNARSKPVTLAYGDLLARLVGYLEEVSTWDPSLLRSELQSRPWFL